MKTLKNIFLTFALIVLVGCNEEEKGRFNYPFIKSKIDLSEEQTEKFDEITKEYTSMAKKAWIDSNGDEDAADKAQKIIFAEQDAEIKKVLNDKQYSTYFKEVNIERKGREEHALELIKNDLKLDSTQTVKYDLVNETFFTTLRNNHDNYHGKPDVYLQYYKEIDVSRKKAFKVLMTEEQYTTYLKLVEKYNIGKSEH